MGKPVVVSSVRPLKRVVDSAQCGLVLEIATLHRCLRQLSSWGTKTCGAGWVKQAVEGP
jgi:hypothetical protein